MIMVGRLVAEVFSAGYLEAGVHYMDIGPGIVNPGLNIVAVDFGGQKRSCPLLIP